MSVAPTNTFLIIVVGIVVFIIAAGGLVGLLALLGVFSRSEEPGPAMPGQGMGPGPGAPTCGNCGAALPAGSLSCPNCGSTTPTG